jgi:hypothetical protein
VQGIPVPRRGHCFVRADFFNPMKKKKTERRKKREIEMPQNQNENEICTCATLGAFFPFCVKAAVCPNLKIVGVFDCHEK